MIVPRLRETWHFFWEHLTDLLWRLMPVAFPLLLLSQYRWLLVHDGDQKAASGDFLMLLPAVLASVMATGITLHYAVAIVDGAERSRVMPLRAALADAPRLIFVQLLAGLCIMAGLLLLILPGIYLMGLLLPAYVLVVKERRSTLDALREAWLRFRPGAWWLGFGVMGLLLILLVVMSGLQALAGLTDGVPAFPRLLICTGLEVLGLLCAQIVPILLVRFYVLEREAAGGTKTV